MCSWTHYNVLWNGSLVTVCNRWGSLSGVSDVQVFWVVTLCRWVTSGWIGVPVASPSTLEDERHSVVRLNTIRPYLCPGLKECSINQIASAISLAEQPWRVCLTADGLATKPKVMGQSCDVFLKQIVNFGLHLGEWPFVALWYCSVGRFEQKLCITWHRRGAVKATRSEMWQHSFKFQFILCHTQGKLLSSAGSF